MLKVGDKVRINIPAMKFMDQLDKEDYAYIVTHPNKVYEVVEVLKNHQFPYVIDDENGIFQGGINFSENELIKVVVEDDIPLPWEEEINGKSN